jgi:tetratricopeptide (TPR) repeat protein
VSEKCRAKNASHKWVEAVKPCGEAVTIAERFPDPRLRADQIRRAYEAYGEALAHSGNAAEALSAFQKTTAIAETLTATDDEYALAYYWEAYAEHSLGMPVEAERDYNIAESSFRKAIVDMPNMKNIYSKQLAHTLALHSVLAHQTGKDADSFAMQKEARELDPHSMDGVGVKH